MKKRLFAYLLALALCLSLLPAAALAAGDHGEHTGWTALTADTTRLESGKKYYLSGDVKYTGSGAVTVTGDVTLCLNGHVLDLNGRQIQVKGAGAHLTLCDCTSDTTKGNIDSNGLWKPLADNESVPDGLEAYPLIGGVITGGRSSSGGCGVYVYYGTFTMTGGNIAGNSPESGGGVFVDNGTFIMTGGSITGNSASNGIGGGVYVENGTFQMSGSASLAQNSAPAGGGVYVGNGTFTMEGGSITGNRATRGGGGGVFTAGSFTMTGGSITGNTTDNQTYGFGGGVCLFGRFSLSGNPIIRDNTKAGTPDNLYLGWQTINITGALGQNTHIGVTADAESVPRSFTSGWKDNMGEENPAKYFTSEQAGYHVARAEDGEAALAANTYTVTFDPNGGDGSMGDQAFTYDKTQALTPNAFTRTGYTFAGWSTKQDGTGTTYEDEAQVSNLTATDGDTVTLTAQWTANTYTVTFDPNGGEGSMGSQTFTYDDQPQALTANTFTRPGYTFTGWNTKADGTGTPYEGGAELTLAENLTLYAQWAYIPPYIPPTTGYAITAVTDGNGTVTVNPTSAKAGDTVTVTAVPKEGYEVGAITVTTVLGQNVPVTGNTFVMPDAAVTVQVAFVKAAALPFTDVAEGDWFYADVLWAYENGLMEGVGGGSFAPGSSVSRSMVWAVLARMDGQAVSGSSWAQEARAWAMAAGVSDGTMAGEDVTREQLATMLYRFAQAKGWDVSVGEDTNILSYADAGQISEWAVPAMQWACGAGILQGSDGSLNPGDSASRAELAAMLARFARL